MVSDTGVGMSEEFLKRIFEPFTQAGSDARCNYQGTGMGMPIVKGFVEKMDGSIDVTSTQGEGSSCSRSKSITRPSDMRVLPTPKANAMFRE